MLRTLALVLLVTLTAVACKTDDAKQSQASAGASSDPAAQGGPRPRSGKIEVPQRLPSLSGPEAEGKPAAAAEDGPEDGRKRRRERMTTIDTDGDGEIRDAEREAARQKMLARIDTDGDGKVSEAERAAGRRMRADEIRTRLDANGDGKVSADELTNGPRVRGLDMKQVDTNSDGDVSADELDTALRNRGPRRRGGDAEGEAATEPPPAR